MATSEALQEEIEALKLALLDLVVQGESGALVSTRPTGAAALQRASRILKRPGFAPYSYD